MVLQGWRSKSTHAVGTWIFKLAEYIMLRLVPSNDSPTWSWGRYLFCFKRALTYTLWRTASELQGYCSHTISGIKPRLIWKNLGGVSIRYSDWSPRDMENFMEKGHTGVGNLTEWPSIKSRRTGGGVRQYELVEVLICLVLFTGRHRDWLTGERSVSWCSEQRYSKLTAPDFHSPGSILLSDWAPWREDCWELEICG